MTCRLEVRCSSTSFGEVLAIVGGSADLGDWDPKRARVLETDPGNFPVWTAEVPVSIIGCELKFIILAADGSAKWEDIPNRCWSFASSGASLAGSTLVTSYGDGSVRLRLPSPDDLDDDSLASQPTVARALSMRPSRYTFKPTVTCFEVPDLKAIESNEKELLWWQASDFADFLRSRVEIAKAYERAVEEGRVDSFKQDPMLQNESRRGLGLGRGKVRVNSTRSYISAVLNEQARQRRLGIKDDDRMREVAHAISKIDLAYSMQNAARDELESREYRSEVAEAETPAAPEVHPETTLTLGMQRVESFGLFVPQTDADEDLDPSHSPKAPSTTKGFGLAPEDLKAAGIRATGRTDCEV
eukprot:TRINITY_DN258_c0_g6_i1.p1 TRINITY_DN258_c0_g6~~TRINITY_DN258_c0_g6_i1.p1  ORF type:complete len:413 (-),score=74.52 TRINITY_DN258_c0_g6_i1:310-1380(-)